MSYFTDGGKAITADKPQTVKGGKKGAVLIWLVNNIAGIASVLLIDLIVYLIFIASFDLSGSEIQEQVFSALGVIIIGTTIVLYLNGYSTGGTGANKLAETIETRKTYNSAVSRIITENLTDKLDAFCEEYKDRELKEVISDKLAVVGITYGEYQKILSGESLHVLTDKQKKVIDGINKIKPIKLDRSVILTIDGQGHKRNPITPLWKIQLYKYAQMGIKGLTVTLASMFTVAVSVKINYKTDFETVVYAILQAATLCGSFVSGFIAGRNVTTKLSRRTAEINNIIEEFFTWQNTH